MCVSVGLFVTVYSLYTCVASYLLLYMSVYYFINIKCYLSYYNLDSIPHVLIGYAIYALMFYGIPGILCEVLIARAVAGSQILILYNYSVHLSSSSVIDLHVP